MDHKREIDGTEVWSNRRGELRIRTPVKGLILIRFSGDFLDEFASQVAESTHRVAVENDKYTAFHDWEHMDTYETASRIRLTNVALQVLHKTEAIHLLVGSQAVAVGVQVANLLVKRITSYTDRARFDAALQRVVITKGGSGLIL